MWTFLRFVLVFCSLVCVTACVPLPAPSHPSLPATTTLTTVLGAVSPVELGDGGVSRFTLPFAQPPVGPLRFANPQPVEALNGYNVSNTPPACFQGVGDPRGGNAASEDCLYATYYKPSTSQPGDNLPVYVWLHGGSGIVGSSTGAGLDGAPFVKAENVIVVLLQYRLGLFGWLQTGTILDEANGGESDSSTVAGNQAMRDAVLALEQVKAMAPLLGGDPSKIVLMGQSSGATMVRALLSTPAADGLFSHAVLVSDPANYGLSSIADNNILGEFAMQQLQCDVGNITCAREASADAILDATLAAYSQVPQDHPSISSGTPWRAMKGAYVKSSIEGGAKTDIPVIMTTVANEAGTVTSFQFEEAPANATQLTFAYSDGQTTSVNGAISLLYGKDRANVLSNSMDKYPIADINDGIRQTFETIATDGLWRCSTQHNGQQLAGLGGQVWLAEWHIGATYPSNAMADYCTRDGHVCHEDDIFIIFATAPAPSPAVQQLSREFQARLSSFARDMQPDAPGTVSWPSIQSPSNLNLLALGSAGKATTTLQASQRPEVCRQLWGDSVNFDWQLYES